MCGCLSFPSRKVFLVPLRGPYLGLKEGETWIGRGSFEASARAQLMCSRRQALIRFSETSIQLECHGCNPLYFVICHSKGFFATQTTPASQLYQLRKGEAVDLTDGDQFYFMAMECLLTVVITQYDTGRNSKQSSQPPLVGGVTVMDETRTGRFKPDMDQFDGELRPNSEGKTSDQGLCERIGNNQASAHCGISDLQTPYLKTGPFLGMSYAEDPTVDIKRSLSDLPGDERKGMSTVDNYPPTEKLGEVGGHCEVDDCNILDSTTCKPLCEGVPVLGVEACVLCRMESATDLEDLAQPSSSIIEDHQPEAQEQVGEVMVDCEAMYDLRCASLPHEVSNSIIQPEAKEQMGEAMLECEAVDDVGCASSPHEVHNPVVQDYQYKAKEHVEEEVVGCEAVDDVGCVSSPYEVCNPVIQDHQPKSKEQVDEVMVDCEALHDVGCASSPCEVHNPIIQLYQPKAKDHVEEVMVDCEALDDVRCASSYGCREKSPCFESLVNGPKTALCRVQAGCLQTPLPDVCGLDAQIPQRAWEESTLSKKDGIEPPRVASHHSEPECDIAHASSSSKISALDPAQADKGNGSISTVNDSRNGRSRTKDAKEHLDEAQKANVTNGKHDSVQCANGDIWPLGPVDGMGPVIASLSGYEGLDRNHLVKLINTTGASFTGDLTQFNTHLVCWKFRGKKFDCAMKLHTVVLNHRWFEDSLRAGKRLPEEPYKLQSGENVGPLQWKGPSTLLVAERAETSSRAGISKDHPPFFSDGIEDEVQNIINPQLKHMSTLSNSRSAPDEGNFGRDKEGQQLHHTRGTVTESAEAGSRHVGVRKLQNVDKSKKGPTIPVREDLVGKDMSAYGSSSRRTKQSHQKRVGEIGVYISEPSSLKRGRKLRKVGEAVDMNDNELERARPGCLLETAADYNLGTNTVGCLSLEGRHQTDARIFIDLSDDVENNMQDTGLMGPQAESSEGKSCQAIEDADGKRMKGKCSQSSQASQAEKEIACAICLVDAKCPIEGLLECGHVFCFKCIFTWSVQAVKGPSCPLCKAACEFITRREWDQAGDLQETVVVVGKSETNTGARNSRTIVMDAVCIQCGNSDSESLLLRCGTCGERACHTFCMDPPAPPPWYCPGCAHGHQRESMRLAWNHSFPGSSTGANHWSDQERRPVRRSSSRMRRMTQPYGFRPPRPSAMYRPSLHREVMESMGPVRRRAIVGQDSLSTWLDRTSDAVE